MFHVFALPVVTPQPKSFHLLSLLFRLPLPFCPALLVENEEVVLRAMQQYPQIIAIHAKFLADLVFLLFFQEDSAQQLTIFFGKQGQYLSYLLAGLLADQKPIQVQYLVNRFRSVLVQLGAMPGGAVELL